MQFSSSKFSSFSGPFFTLLAGFILNIFPWGNSPWVPDFLLVVLAFWVLQAPEKINLLTAFILGLLMDIQTTQILGVHAIVYVCTCFMILYAQRRLSNTTLLGQTFILLQVFLLANLIQLFILWVIGQGKEISLAYLFLPSLIEAFLWPLLKRLLSARFTFLNNNHN
jgi:rod shape-determining protein MreD